MEVESRGAKRSDKRRKMKRKNPGKGEINSPIKKFPAEAKSSGRKLSEGPVSLGSIAIPNVWGKKCVAGIKPPESQAMRITKPPPFHCVLARQLH